MEGTKERNWQEEQDTNNWREKDRDGGKYQNERN